MWVLRNYIPPCPENFPVFEPAFRQQKIDSDSPIRYYPSMHCNAGIYKLTCGDYFYIGVSKSLKTRRTLNESALRRGSHHSPKLQRAFLECGSVSFEVLEYLTGDFKKFLRAEAAEIQKHIGNPYLCNIAGTPDYVASTPSAEAIERVRKLSIERYEKDPTLRERSRETSLEYYRDPVRSKPFRDLMASRRGRKFTQEQMDKIKAIMGERKGDANPTARKAKLIYPDGSEKLFMSLCSIKAFLGVTHSTLKRLAKNRVPLSKTKWTALVTPDLEGSIIELLPHPCCPQTAPHTQPPTDSAPSPCSVQAI